MSTEKITVYISSVTGSKEIKKQQQRIKMILESKKVEFEEVDISTSEDSKKEMREKAGDEKKLPPTICKGDVYCGDYEKFDEAVENAELMKFLKLA